MNNTKYKLTFSIGDSLIVYIFNIVYTFNIVDTLYSRQHMDI